MPWLVAAALRVLAQAVGLASLLDRLGPTGRLLPVAGAGDAASLLTQGELQRLGMARVLYRC
jgi:ABC-type uncharacterized transport system fused permease/ATPase subunit